MTKIPTTIRLSEETKRQIQWLAEKWGMPDTRNVTSILERCVERAYQQENSKSGRPKKKEKA